MIITKLENIKRDDFLNRLIKDALEKSPLHEREKLQGCIDRFFQTGIDETQNCLNDLTQDTLDTETQLQFYDFIEKLRTHHFLNYEILEDNLDAPFAVFLPLGPHFYLKRDAFLDLQDLSFKLSYFSLLRQKEGVWSLETPLAAAKIELVAKEAFEIVRVLSKFSTIDELRDKFNHLPETVIHQFLSFLVNAHALEDEEKRPELLQWEFHDLYFHAKSRGGRHNNPTGAHYPFVDKIEAPKLLKNGSSNPKISLVKPSFPSQESSFLDVLEKRRSIRRPGDRPIHVNELSEFLYYSARIKKQIKSDYMELSLRPSANGGAIHELEIYPIVSTCLGLEKGLYRYDPLNHELEVYPFDKTLLEFLLTGSKLSMGSDAIPQILFVISARFNRVSWKYRSISYAITLKNTGVLIQTMYLVATSMNLAPCANGNGDSDRFSKLIQSNYFEESSVGEFALSAL